jgi:hypothetical protein
MGGIAGKGGGEEGDLRSKVKGQRAKVKGTFDVRLAT